jgi:hypothetical protein
MRSAAPTRPHGGLHPHALISATFLVLSLAGCAGADAGQGSADSAANRAVASGAAAQAPDATGGPAPGKYGCSESVTRLRDGAFEYEPQGRGFVTLARDGRYTDPFGVEGTYRHDVTTQETRFTGGALDRAVATPLEEGGRLRVVIPTESGERRWSCSPT